jgi:hypothetical protein
MMTTASCTLNVEQEIAKIKTPCLIFQLVLTAAMTLFQVRWKKRIVEFKFDLRKTNLGFLNRDLPVLYNYWLSYEDGKAFLTDKIAFDSSEF